jgi:glutathione S-transferase
MQISLADIASFGWVYWAGWAGVDIEEFPNVKKWEALMTSRQAVDKGKDIPKKLTVKEKIKDPDYAEKMAAQAREWIMKGMGDDKEKK